MRRYDIENKSYFSTSFLSEEEARAAFANFVSEHCCYGSGPVEESKIISLSSSNSYKVIFYLN